MSNGEDLLNALRKVNCPHLEEIDADSLDWHFENTEFASFLREFCSRIEFGQLQKIDCFSEECYSQTEVSLHSLLAPELKEYSGLANCIEQRERRIQEKKDYIALQKHKLKLIKKENAKADLKIGTLEKAAKSNNEKLSAMKKKTKGMKKHFSALLKVLEKSHDRLLAALSDSPANADSEAHSTKLEAENHTLHSSSLSLCPRLESYIEKERALFEQLEKLAGEKTQEKLDSEAHLLLQEWQSEQLRLQKCFSMTVKSYNHLRALESTLHREIDILKKIVERKMPIQDILNEAEKSNEPRDVYLPDSEMQRRSNEACDRLANKALASIFLTNYKIKLERLQEDLNHQEKVLELLRTQQVRLSLLQLSQKLEAQRRTQLLSFCQNINQILKETEDTYRKGIETLRAMKANEEQVESELVPIDDQVMKTVASVLGSDPEELIPRFDSIAQAAVVMDRKVKDGQNTNAQNLETILGKINDLKALNDILNEIQEPITASTDYHGNVNLAGAMKKLKENMKVYISSIIHVQTSFEYFKKDLESNDREKFERIQKIKNIMQKIHQK